MDEAGWASIEDVLKELRISRSQLDEAVINNNKQRLQVLDGKIRATQGHSCDNKFVTVEGLERSWKLSEIEHSIWHATHFEAALSIAQQGILAQDRTHVHLASSTSSHVGKRSNCSVHVEVSCVLLRDNGLNIFESPNGVILVRNVPSSCIVGLYPQTSKAKQRMASEDFPFQELRRV